MQDVGDNRPTAIAPSYSPVALQVPAFYAAQTFPPTLSVPAKARISVRINEKLRWNAGYQYYGYNQEFSSIQNYRANTGYSSVAWSF